MSNRSFGSSAVTPLQAAINELEFERPIYIEARKIVERVRKHAFDLLSQVAQVANNPTLSTDALPLAMALGEIRGLTREFANSLDQVEMWEEKKARLDEAVAEAQQANETP